MPAPRKDHSDKEEGLELQAAMRRWWSEQRPPRPVPPREVPPRNEGLCPQAWIDLRPELSIPGFWDALTENCAQWAEEVNLSQFWRSFDKSRSAWSNEFYQRTGDALLASDQLPTFTGKKHARMKEKILQLTKGPNAKVIQDLLPVSGPPVPRLNDLVRTRVQCKFLDGVEFVAQKLQDLAEGTGVKVSRDRMGLLEGYFAQHLCFEHDLLFRFGGNSQQVKVKCEVQIATQLSTRIWDESHNIYEQWRAQDETQDEWQWDPTELRFIARQLGHMIHLADGLLVQLRNARFKKQRI